MDISVAVSLYKQVSKSGPMGINLSDLSEKTGIPLETVCEGIKLLKRKGMVTIEGDGKNPSNTMVYDVFNCIPHEKYKLLKSLPCFTCPDLNNCDVNRKINPLKCKEITKWLIDEVCEV